jgi:magnesium transporter
MVIPFMLTICTYNKDSFSLQSEISLSQTSWPDGTTIWLDFDSRPDEEEITRLTDKLSIHPIAIKNLFDESLRPRLQEFPGQVYLGARAIVQDGTGEDISLCHLGLFIGKHFLITSHSGPLSILARSATRLESNAGDALSLGPDYLLYLMLDSLVDDYYSEVDQMAETIDEIDSRAGETYDKHLQHDVSTSKRRLLMLHKAITPLRDILLNLRRTDQAMISAHTEIYLRDIFEHVLQLLDTIDTYREVLSNTTELAMAAASNRMNEVMTVLTVVTSFFIPLNFIVGYFGMNLLMPEIKNAVTYPVAIVLMLMSVFGMLIWFKRKKWL